MRLNTIPDKTQRISRRLRRALMPALIPALMPALLCGAGLLGCSSNRPVHVWTDEAIAAEGLQDRGELEAAAQAYERLLQTAPDAERRRLILFNQAELAERQGDEALALSSYARVYEEARVDRFGARALLRAADLRASDDSSGEEAALPMWREVIRRYPDEVAAEDALDRIIEHHAEAGRHEALIAELEGHYEAVGDSLLGDNLLLRAALHHDQVMGQPDAALDAFRRLLRDHPDGPLADDALWEMAAIYREHQRWAPAVALLERLTSDVDSSWFVGSYASDWVDDGIFELGRIHLLHLGDHERAIAYFERFIADYPDATLTDDAAWHLVEARRLQGDAGRYREALEQFVEAFDYSRHVDTARRRLDALGSAQAGGAAR